MNTRHLLASCVCVSIIATTASVTRAAPVVWYGEIFSFACPPPISGNPPLDSQSPYQLTLGLGSEPVWIGSGVSIPVPGLYDLSSDPNVPAFLDMLFDGTPEPLKLKIAYAQGSLAWTYPIDFEDYWFNNYQEGGLHRSDVSGIQLEVLSFYPDNDGVTVRWNLTGVPEPSTLAVLLLGAALASRRRHPGSKP